MKPEKERTHSKRPMPLPRRPRPLRYRTVKAHQKSVIPRHLEEQIAIMEKAFPLAKWYFLGSVLLVIATACIIGFSCHAADSNMVLMLFLAGILMLTFLFCIPLAIMNILSKDYWFTAAVVVLAYFMVGAHFKILDTLGVANIQIQAGMFFLGICLVAVVILYIKTIQIR